MSTHKATADLPPPPLTSGGSLSTYQRSPLLTSHRPGQLRGPFAKPATSLATAPSNAHGGRKAGTGVKRTGKGTGAVIAPPKSSHTALTAEPSLPPPSTTTPGTPFLGDALSRIGSPLSGESLNPHAYQPLFSFSGKFSAVAFVSGSASIWAGSKLNGCIEIFSACTGRMTASLPPRILIPNTVAEGYKQPSSETSNPTQPATSAPKPTALRASATHVWAGYENGNVAVYEHLVHTVVTEGCFHRVPVVGFGFFLDGTVVSAAQDGSLVHWDSEVKNFGAITSVKGKEPSELLSCIAASHRSWVAVCGFESGLIQVVDVSNGAHCVSQSHHHERITALVLADDLIFSAAEDQMVLVWHLEASELSPQTFTLAGCGGTHVIAVKLLRRIPVQPSVCSLSWDRPTDSLWVGYVDGMIERWSANQDDEFGVEEVVREGVRVRQREGEQVVQVVPFGAVETLQVLALSSNGINNIWYGHYNSLEDQLQQSVATLNLIITQDAADTSVWRTRMEELKRREKERKRRYVVLAAKLSEQRVLLRFYERWRRRVARPTIAAQRAHQRIATAQFLENTTSFELRRRYFKTWIHVHDSAKKGALLQHTAAALEGSTRRSAALYFFTHWRAVAYEKRARSTMQHWAKAMERANRAALLSRFYFRWFQRSTNAGKRSPAKSVGGRSAKHAAGSRASGSSRMVCSDEQLKMLHSKSQIYILQRAMRKWRRSTTYLPSSLLAEVEIPTEAWVRSSSQARFAELFFKMQKEKVHRSLFLKWQQWVTVRKRSKSLAVAANLFLKQQQVSTLRFRFIQWEYFVHQQRIQKTNAELVLISRQIQEMRSERGDVDEKLRLKKHMDELGQQLEKDTRELEKEEGKLQELRRESDVLRERTAQQAGGGPGGSRKTLGKAPSSASTAIPMARHTAWYQEVLSKQRLLPSVLLRMSASAAEQHVMAQLKGNALNLYLDLSLMKELRERQADAVVVFGEAFANIKRMVMPAAGRDASHSASLKTGGKVRTSSLRWQLYMETLDVIPVAVCTPLLKAIKTLLITYDLLPSERPPETVLQLNEIIANGDWMFLLSRACHLRLRPVTTAFT